MITSGEFYTDTPLIFRTKLQQQLTKYKPDFVLFRDKETQNYKTLAKDFLEVCAEFQNLKAFIHGDIDLAYNLHAKGVHLTSTMFDKIRHAKALNLEVIISTHTVQEVLNAQKAGADYVSYSPIFASPNKGEPKGTENLKELLSQTDIKVFALGGIVSQEHIKSIKKTKVFGFASIRYFY